MVFVGAILLSELGDICLGPFNYKCNLQSNESFPTIAGLGSHPLFWEMCTQFRVKAVQGGDADSSCHHRKAGGEPANTRGEPSTREPPWEWNSGASSDPQVVTQLVQFRVLCPILPSPRTLSRLQEVTSGGECFTSKEGEMDFTHASIKLPWFTENVTAGKGPEET